MIGVQPAGDVEIMTGSAHWPAQKEERDIMEQTGKTEPLQAKPVAAPKPVRESAGLKLRIEELDPRLAPQSSTSILD
jgi:hypothetical protein